MCAYKLGRDVVEVDLREMLREGSLGNGEEDDIFAAKIAVALSEDCIV